MTRAFFLASLLSTALLAGCGSSGPKDAEPPKADAQAPKDVVILTPAEQATGKIETQTIGAADTPDLLKVAGRIARADDHTWRVGVRTEGLVRTVSVNLGDLVKKDQVLARYHADEVREGRAKYQTAVADLQRLEAAAALAKRNHERAQTLLELKAASVAQVDQARQDQVAADAAVKNGRTEVERAKDLLEDELHVPVEAAPGDESASQVPILAPESGFILEKNVTPGRTIAPGQDAFVIGDLSVVWMLASVRQDVLEQLHVGQVATVTLPGLGQERFTGKLANLGQELDPTTRTMAVRIVLSNPNHRLRPEMLANADIALARSTSQIAVPSDAIQQVNGQDVVFVKTAEDRFTVRAVRVGPTLGGRTPVLEGLKGGEQIAVRGTFTLKSHLLRSSMIEG